MKIQVILGSVRDNRFGIQPANWIFEKLKAIEGIEAEFIDLKDWNLPMFTEATPPSMNKGQHSTELMQKWSDKIASADGYIIVTPEYNHSFSSALKNAIDYLYTEWNNKAVAFVSYGSVAGGSRAVEQLRQVAVELQMAPTRTGVHLTSYYTNLDENGKFRFETYEDTGKTLIDQLVWWTKALKTAREVK